MFPFGDRYVAIGLHAFSIIPLLMSRRTSYVTGPLRRATVPGTHLFDRGSVVQSKDVLSLFKGSQFIVIILRLSLFVLYCYFNQSKRDFIVWPNINLLGVSPVVVCGVMRYLSNIRSIFYCIGSR